MKVRMKDCKNCGKQYGATNGNQLYCCDVCRQQAYYKRHGIDRSQRPIYGTNVNHQFTPITQPTPKTDVNPPTKEIEQITPAKVTQVKPLIETSLKTTSMDNFTAILEQMNNTHPAPGINRLLKKLAPRLNMAAAAFCPANLATRFPTFSSAFLST